MIPRAVLAQKVEGGEVVVVVRGVWLGHCTFTN